MQVRDAGDPLALEDDVEDLVLFAYVDAVFGGVLEQDVIELGADNLEGGGALAGVVGEVPAPGVGILAPDECGAVLDHETGGLDRGHDSDLFEDGNAGRQEGFADVFAGEFGALQQGDPVALVGEQRGAG